MPVLVIQVLHHYPVLLDSVIWLSPEAMLLNEAAPEKVHAQVTAHFVLLFLYLYHHSIAVAISQSI